MLKNNHRGRYNNDYSPQYSDPYDIYDKAKEHMKKLRQEERKENIDDGALHLDAAQDSK